jgi:hypothetical protein
MAALEATKQPLLMIYQMFPWRCVAENGHTWGKETKKLPTRTLGWTDSKTQLLFLHLRQPSMALTLTNLSWRADGIWIVTIFQINSKHEKGTASDDKIRITACSDQYGWSNWYELKQWHWSTRFVATNGFYVRRGIVVGKVSVASLMSDMDQTHHLAACPE